MAANFTPADIALITADPQLSQEYHPGFGDFRTDYLSFDTYHAPFNDLKVRQAFAQAIDRDLHHQQHRAKAGHRRLFVPDARFPGSVLHRAGQRYREPVRPGRGQEAAGGCRLPGRQRLPKLTLELRQENDLNKAVANAIAGMLKDNLGMQVDISNIDPKTFMADLNAHKIPFYMVSYGFDYLDASNMLGVWLSKGRHAWKNDQFDKLITDATSFIGDPGRPQPDVQGRREDPGGRCRRHLPHPPHPGDIYRPYLKGSELEPDKTGVATWHWPAPEDISTLPLTLYIANTVDPNRK